MRLWRFVGIVIDLSFLFFIANILGEILSFFSDNDVIFYIGIVIVMIGVRCFINSLSNGNSLGKIISRKIISDHTKNISVIQVIICIIVIGLISKLVDYILLYVSSFS